jgi:hypothetical protein
MPVNTSCLSGENREGERMRASFLVCFAALGIGAFAQPGLTIYNGRFAVVRDTVPLELKAGENSVRYFGATSHLDPSTVILRDPSGKVQLSIREQNYQNDPVNELTLLDRYEGQTLSFLVHDPKGDRTTEGKVIRSGYIPGGEPLSPVVEVDGKILFDLPGKPLFPSVKDDSVLLKPLLNWKIQSSEPATLEAELAYLTSGLEWSASYNFVLPEEGELADMNGWVTVQNRSGKQFENAQIKLMAGDVRRVQPRTQPAVYKGNIMRAAMAAVPDGVEEKTFDDYHLYAIQRPTTLRDQETKQIEFTRASAVPTRRVYTYDPAPGLQFVGQTILDREWNAGIQALRKVATSLEFTNSEASHIGVPLPAGQIRVYRKDGPQLEFVGEDSIPHTPRNEVVRLNLGNAFDLTGDRVRTDFSVDQNNRTMEERFEIRLNNRGKKPVQIRVVEHLVRAANWSVSEKNLPFQKLDSNTIEFKVAVAPEREAVVNYTVRYTW